MRGPVCPDPTGDLGQQDFIYSLFPHAGSWSDADLTNRARVFNDPFTAVYCPRGQGWPDRSYLSLSAPNLVIDAVKAAEDGKGYVIRLNETQKKRGSAVLTLPVKPKKAFLCNLMEENEQPLPVAGNTVTFGYTPFEAVTLRLIP